MKRIEGVDRYSNGKIKSTPAQNRERTLRSVYGLEMAEWEAILLAHRNSCAICGRGDRKLIPDHDHITGVVRGPLCRACNTALGNLGDDVAGVRRALDYLLRVES